MDDMCGLDSTGDHDYADEALMSPENLMIPLEYHYQYHDYYHSSLVSDHPPHHHHQIPVVVSEELAAFHSRAAVTSQESASINHGVQNHHHKEEDDDEASCSVIKAKIASHPSYPKLLHAYIDCQKFGAPPEVMYLLDEITREKDLTRQDDAVSSMCFGLDPQLDHFMETYCELLVKFKSDLSRPFDEATSFLNNAQTQLLNLCNDDVLSWSDEELSNKEGEIDNSIKDGELLIKSDGGQLKDKLLRMYGSHISSLKHEFSKKKKKGKLPKEATQSLLQWWNLHCKWPYPTECDKIALAESTGLDQKQINNWFINQRKRHWKSPENLQLAILDNLSSHFFPQD